MKDYSHAKLFLDWAEVINTLATEVQILSNKEKKKTMYLLHRRMKMSLVAFFAPIACKWWEAKKVRLKKGEEWKAELPLLDEDRSMFEKSVARMLSNDCWSIIEGYFRGNREDGIWKIITDKMGTIPPAINTLRLLRNCWHNLGIHTGQYDVIHKIRGYTFSFIKGKPVKNFHLFAILQLIDEAAIELINS